MDGKKYITALFIVVLLASLFLGLFPTEKVLGEAEIKPSKGWGMFYGTTGDVKINITEPAVAVRVEVPRSFLLGTPENDTSFIKSDISNDYFYYSVIDQSLHYPYDDNAPYTIEIWNPPSYLLPTCVGKYYNFTPPKYILLEDLIAPSIAGIYNFTVYLAINMSGGQPFFPPYPDKVMQVPVSMREDPSHIYGYIEDDLAKEYILTKGVVYAVEVDSGMIGRGFVNSTTGFFNVTGLYAGEYRLEGSAGYFPETGFAYAVTTSSRTWTIGKGTGVNAFNLSLNRGNIIDGSIIYLDEYSNPIRPLDSPYLSALNYNDLNYTVEAYDENNVIVASRIYSSNNDPTEYYTLYLRNGTEHVGYPATGTEYAGFGPGTYTIKVWVYGFTLPEGQIKTVTFLGYGLRTNVGDSRLPYGSVVSGTIRLFAVPGMISETPREGEIQTFGSSTGKHFGGNILVEMYNGGGTLRGLVVYNRTLPNGVVQYADFSSGEQTPLLKFYVLGFSELHNKSYSGAWTIGSRPGPSPWDYGIEAGTYYLRVWIRGYVQLDVEDFTLGDFSNHTINIDLVRGGATEVTVMSMTSKPGTRVQQAPTTWRFNETDLCPAPRMRVYFYSSIGVEVGYAENILEPGRPGVTETTATVNFTGHNWPLDKIIYLGYVPNALTTDTYTLRAYTYGYIQAMDVSLYIPLSDFVPTAFPLLLGCRIFGSVPLTDMDGLFVALTENATIRQQALLLGDLKGVDVINATLGSQIFSFSNYGFYGRGHFFYVDPDGVRWKDYGLDVGYYSVYIPVFGYDRKFIQTLDIYANLPDLAYEVGSYYHMERMVKIFGTVTGDTYWGHPPIIPLVWVSVEADGYTEYSFDGDYALHIPETSFTVTYSAPGYETQTRTASTNDQIEFIVNLEQTGEPFP